MAFLVVLCTDMPRAWHGLIAASIDDTSRTVNFVRDYYFFQRSSGGCCTFRIPLADVFQKDVLVETLSMVTSRPWQRSVDPPVLYRLTGVHSIGCTRVL